MIILFVLLIIIDIYLCLINWSKIMQKIIGICGLKGSGKDTIAKIICENDSSFITVAFADCVKDIASIMFGWPREMLSGRTIESRAWREQPDVYWSEAFGFEFTPRRALTTLGTDIIHDTFLKHIWDLNVKKKILSDHKHNFVITDVRFPNEIEMIKSIGGNIVQVERGERPEYWKAAEKQNKGQILLPFETKSLLNIHPSESAWIGVNDPEYIFYNNSTIEDLTKEVIEYFGLKK